MLLLCCLFLMTLPLGDSFSKGLFLRVRSFRLMQQVLYEDNAIVNIATTSSSSRRGKYPRLELYDGKSYDYKTDIYLEEVFRGIEFDEVEICGLLRSQYRPMLQRLHENQQLQPKLFYFRYTCSRFISWSDIKESLISNIQLLGLDLVHVISLRHAFLQYIGVLTLLSSKTNQGHHVHSNRIDDKNQFWNISTLLECKLDEFHIKVSQLLSANEKIVINDYNNTSSSTIQTAFESFQSQYFRGGLSAVKECNINLLSIILQQGWHPDSDIDRTGRTVLMWAAANPANAALSDYQQSICLLLDFYRSQRPLSKYQPLSLLHLELTKKTVSGESIFHWVATAKNSLPVYQQLYKELLALSRSGAAESKSTFWFNNEKTHVIHWAAGSGNLELVKHLLAQNGHVLVHLQNQFGCSLLHFAASAGQLSILKYLHDEYGQGDNETFVDFGQTNHHGHDILTKAVAFKQNDVARWILQENIANAQQTVTNLRPWELETSKDKYHIVKENSTSRMSLLDIATIVGNNEIIPFLEKFF